MRVLFSCTGGDGHFLPLLPLARAAAAAGHDVAFAAAADLQPRVEAAGLEGFTAGVGVAEAVRRFAPELEKLDLPSVPIPKRREIVYRTRFAKVEAPTKLDDLRRIASAWHPEILVHESCELAGPIVAAEHGIASIHHSFGRTLPAMCVRGAAEDIEPLWRNLDLEPDAQAGLYRGTYVDICPPTLQDELPPEGTIVQPLRPADARREPRTPRPLVYITLGTVFNNAPLFRDLLSAVAPLPCDVVVTTGPNIDPAELEPVPTNVQVHAYVPQSEILPRADIVVGHGGSGSTWGALAHGCPLVVLPQFADQFENAGAATAAGAALTLLPAEQSMPAIREAVRRLLAEPSFALAAERIGEEIAAMPTAAEAAAALFGS